MLARISLFHKFLIKFVIYSLVFILFFVYWSNICIFQTIRGKIPFLMLYLHILWQCPKQNCILKKNKVRISPEEGFLMSRLFMILFMVSVDTRLNKNSLLILNFFFLAFIIWWKAHFSIMELILSFLDDIEVSSDQLKRFDKSVVDPKCLLKIGATSFCFD